MDRLSNGDFPANVEIEGGGRLSPGLRSRINVLAASIFLIALAATSSGQNLEWGMNLQMAGIAFLASATTMLLYTIRVSRKEE